MTDTRRGPGATTSRQDEHGIALIWAILVMIVVMGIIVVSVGMTLVRTDETRAGANRTRSNQWTQAAADDLAQRLQSREIGYDLATAPTAALDGRDLPIAVPTTGSSALQTPAASFANGPSTQARRLTFTQGGTTHTGWYQVLPPTGTATPWRAMFRRCDGAVSNICAGSPGDQGAIEFLVRAWEDGARAQPVTARLTFRHASFSRFSLLSDDRLQIGGLGNVTLGAYVHSNNARNQPVAIKMDPGTNLAQTRNITSTIGAIQVNGVNCAGKCVANVRDVVEFGSGSRAMDRNNQLAGRTTPINYTGAGVAHQIGGLPMNQTVVYVFWVNLAAPACGDGIQYGRASYRLRQDTGGVPQIDDMYGPSNFTTAGCLPIAEGGGTVLFNGDVIVRGLRTSRHPVTIMAKRTPTTINTVLLDIDGDGIATDPSRMTAPASIFLLQTSNNAGVGSQSPQAPVGLVAEGGIYLPSHAMRANPLVGGLGENANMRVLNVAAMAVGSEVSYGPTIVSVAADGVTAGVGLLPAEARALNYGYGASLEWVGSIASRRPAVFRYGAGGSYLGYGARTLTYPSELLWNPPPGFPSDRDWHLADYREFR